MRLDQFVVEGEKLVARLLESRFPPVSVLVTDRHAHSLGFTVPEDVPTYVLPHALIDRLVGFPFHRGVLACGDRRPWPPIEDLIRRRGDSLFLVVFPKLSDPENLGAIAAHRRRLRNRRDSCGPRVPRPLLRRVLRVSMGSILRVPVVISERLAEEVDSLVRRSGVTLLAATPDSAAVPYDQVARPSRLALVLGDEDRGIEPEWLARCHERITIPMARRPQDP